MSHVLCSSLRLAKAAGILVGLALLSSCGDRDLLTGPINIVNPPGTKLPVTSSAYDVQLRVVGSGVTPRIQEAFTKAIARWREIIVADIGTTRLEINAGECQTWIPAIRESVNDLIVHVRVVPIDGNTKVVAQASPCYVNADNRLPIMGFVELDSADVDDLVQRGLLDDVVLHELGHVLGIGTLWNYKRTLLSGSGTDDPFFNGAEARTAFAGVGGTLYDGEPVPVENSGTLGTRNVHWRASVFGRELMQGFASPGGMPLSRVTIGSLADLGYIVALHKADAFSLFAALRSGASLELGVVLGQDIANTPLFEVDRRGNSRRISAPE